MGYAASTKAILKVKHYLDAMNTSKLTLVWKVSNPKKLAYQIHEAFYSASELNFEKYSKLKERFTIRTSKDKVVAELIDAPSMPEGQLTFSEVIDPLDIVQTVIAHKDITFDLCFPNSSKDEDDVKLVECWCVDNKYEYKVTDDGLIVKKKALVRKLNLGDLE